jgi:hypothetical protein
VEEGIEEAIEVRSKGCSLLPSSGSVAKDGVSSGVVVGISGRILEMDLTASGDNSNSKVLELRLVSGLAVIGREVVKTEAELGMGMGFDVGGDGSAGEV